MSIDEQRVEQRVECECGQRFAAWIDWCRHSERPNGYNPPGPGLHRRVLRPNADPPKGPTK